MGGERRTRGVAAATVAATLLSGCFSYRAAELDSVPVGGEVRVQLTRTGAAELPEVAVGTGSTVRGRVLRREGDQLLLRVPVGVEQEALVAREVGREVAIPAGQIVLVQRRRFDAVKTGAMVAGGAGLLAALVGAYRQVNNEEPGEGGPPPEESARIPIITVRFR